MLIALYPCSGKVLVKVQRPLDLGRAGQISRARDHASPHICVSCGKKGTEIRAFNGEAK